MSTTQDSPQRGRMTRPVTRPLTLVREDDGRQEPTPFDARDRSVALATARGQTATSWYARIMGWMLREDGSLDTAAWWITSATQQFTRYYVIYRADWDDARCECQAAKCGQACWHRGLGVLCGRELARLYSPRGRAEAMRAYWRELAAEGNARALGFTTARAVAEAMGIDLNDPNSADLAEQIARSARERAARRSEG